MASAMPDSANRRTASSSSPRPRRVQPRTRRSEATHDEESDTMLPSLFHRGQLVVRNEGSVTRDYLAYERNYLAWIKLVIACLVISGGLIIRLHVHEDNSEPTGQKRLENRIAIPMGAIFFIVAVLALIGATLSFFSTQSDMLKNLGHVSSGRFTQAISLLVTAVIATACVLLMVDTA